MLKGLCIVKTFAKNRVKFTTSKTEPKQSKRNRIKETNQRILTPVKVTRGDALSTGTINDSIGVKDGEFSIIWTGSSNFSANGIIMDVSFSVNSNVQAIDTDVNVTYSADDTFNDKWSSVELVCNSFCVSVNGIRIETLSESIPVGNIKQLSAKYIFNSANANVIWVSENTMIATVDSNGVVTGKRRGNAVITATTLTENIRQHKSNKPVLRIRGDDLSVMGLADELRGDAQEHLSCS